MLSTSLIAVKTISPCEETKHEATWTNNPVLCKVCASDEADARGSVNDDVIERAIKKKAKEKVDLECEYAGACPGDLPCLQQDAEVTDKERRGDPYEFSDTGEQEDCPDGKTVWNFGIRMDAKVKVQCGCPEAA